MVSYFESTLDLLCSANKLDRDKGVVELERFLDKESALQEENYRLSVQRSLLDRLANPGTCWEKKQGCLQAVKSLATYLKCRNASDVEFYKQTAGLATKYLTDGEPRVRMAAGTVLGVLCQIMGPEVYQETKELVFALIRNNLERIVGDDDNCSRREMYETVQLMDNLMAGPSIKKGIGDPPSFYDTAGWQNLETSLKALQFMIEGCGNDFQIYINEELLGLVFKTLTHSNHFVREAGFYLCSSLLHTQEDGELNGHLACGHELSTHLAEGLADKWSQVRLAASVASRRLFMAVREDSRHLYYPQLLPRMCLNRYYAADGVRMYSQETWRQVAGSAGRDLVERNIDHIVEYYKSATESENCAVREAACSCIAELATKISAVTLRPFVDDLLTVLLNCFQDTSWPVRDAACIACGNLVLSFPEEVRPALDRLYPMFYRNLGDSITSVRQGAATALCNVARGFGKPAMITVVEFVKQGLKNMEKQEATDKTDEGRSFKRMRGSMYAIDGYPSWSKPGNEEDEPMRPPQPWQLADGCVYLIGELSSVLEAHEHVISLVPYLKNAARHKHYEQHTVFLETICKLLPLIARNIGKRAFSSHVEEFFDDIFYALENENRLTSSAASQCLNQLAAFLGQNVLRAKVANYHPRHIAALESVIFVAPF